MESSVTPAHQGFQGLLATMYVREVRKAQEEMLTHIHVEPGLLVTVSESTSKSQIWELHLLTMSASRPGSDDRRMRRGTSLGRKNGGDWRIKRARRQREARRIGQSTEFKTCASCYTRMNGWSTRWGRRLGLAAEAE